MTSYLLQLLASAKVKFFSQYILLLRKDLASSYHLHI